ncbi:hypothetical protein PITCH_A2380001 [uncultured Desulfobacterium sp.]|uniref:Teneurin-like YD-shell domain-containing protein n=1 Tax=uncultured Desulfobacterium sp. TaxID=201089 RepID=A0A445MYH8_9BACT|nr:hypothetical protein PITCH_A2380001 [uncultured Desulfobacterium sp.]
MVLVLKSDVRPDGARETLTIGYTYDSYGRMATKTVAQDTNVQRSQVYFYDERDNITKVETVGGVTTTMQYDGFNRLTMSSAGSEESNFVYDLEDRVIRQSDANDHATAMQYDQRGRLISTVYGDGTPDESRTSVSYQPDDLVSTFTDRAGNVLSYTYDAANRMTDLSVDMVSGFEGVDEKSFAYDGLNRMISASAVSDAGTHSITHSYNSRGDLLRQVQGTIEILSAYNLGGDNIRLRYSTGLELLMNYDSLGRLNNVSTGGRSVARYDFSGPDRLAAAQFGNGTHGRITYNPVHEEDGRNYYSTTGSIQTGFSFGYDDAGRLSSAAYQHAGGSGDNYAYTGEGWISTVRYGLARPLDPDAAAQAATHTTSFQFDESANRINVTRDGLVQNYVSNTLNQYTAVGGQAFTYDRNGNLREDGTRSFVYDAFGHIIRVTETATDAEIVGYAYDALGRMISKTATGGTVNYVYDGDRIIAVMDEGENVLRQYVYGALDASPVMMRRQGADYYYQYDQRGSVIAITDANGIVVERYAYDVDGNVNIFDQNDNILSKSAIDNDFGFIGGLWEAETGLLHLAARDYDPKIGRFLQTDPAGAIDGLNLYAYSVNDPVNFSDPTGLYRQASVGNIKAGSLLDYGFTSNPLVMELTETINLMACFTTLPSNYDYREYNNIGELGAAFVSEAIAFADVVSTVIGAPGIAKGIVALGKGVAELGKRAAGKIAGKMMARKAALASAKAARIATARSAIRNAIQRGFKESSVIGKRSIIDNKVISGICFVKGTLVETEKGKKPIEEIKVGDKVLSKDEKTGQIGHREVTRTFIRQCQEIVEIGFEGKDGGIEKMGHRTFVWVTPICCGHALMTWNAAGFLLG